jgi:hypothetical protein
MQNISPRLTDRLRSATLAHRLKGLFAPVAKNLPDIENFNDCLIFHVASFLLETGKVLNVGLRHRVAPGPQIFKSDLT